MKQLIELGALELIEMGAIRGESIKPSPVLDLFEVVNFMEDPFAGQLEPGDEISARQKAIASRIRNLSLMERKALVNPKGIQGLGYTDLIEEMAGLARELNGLYSEDALGRSLKKRIKAAKKSIKAVGKKVVAVVKSPAFLSVMGAAANLIPAVGPAVSMALTTTAGVMAKKQQQKAAEKEMKKADAAAAMEAQAEQDRQLTEYYNQYQGYFVQYGYTTSVWSTLTTDERLKVAQDLSEGRLQPYKTPDDQAAEVARAAALSTAMQNTYGSQLPGSGVDVSKLPPEIQQQAAALTPQYQQQIQAVGQDNFLAAAVKGVGQGAAINDFFKGTGVELPGGVSDILSQYTGEGKNAGAQDLRNAGAAVGALSDTDEVLNRGGGTEIPWVWIGAGVLGVGAIVGGIAVATRR